MQQASRTRGTDIRNWGEAGIVVYEVGSKGAWIECDPGLVEELER